MQDRYVGDIGDFVKYGLLRALGKGKRLGVAWYLRADDGPTGSGDGRHTEYLRQPDDWRHLDPELFDTLKKLVDEDRRSVAEIQRSGILENAVFADEPLNVDKVAVRDRECWRREWFERVKDALSDCDLVFADPDNGLYPDDRFKPTRKENTKRIRLSETLALAEGRPAVIYHHNGRRSGGHREEIQEWMDRLPRHIHAYYWRRYSNRTFFVVNPDFKTERRLEKFAHNWGHRRGELARPGLFDYHPALGRWEAAVDLTYGRLADRHPALDSKAWPFVEAGKLLDRLESRPDRESPVLFETGYGPSGLPHIGTFGEVARTTMVRNAFTLIGPGANFDVPTRLVVFSDDMDGLRKVPDNVPNRDMVAEHLGKPLTSVPDPFGTHESFGHHNNARLRAFLDDFGFDHEFVSATERYRSGAFDETLIRILERYDEITSVVLPALGPERRATYSPFLPLCPVTGRVLQVPIESRDTDAKTVTYRDEAGRLVEVPVTGGHCKLQWRVDWAMRWVALGVDYEMSGKDLIDSVKLSSRICRILGSEPPEGLTYELFLDENGEKISKSRGNGLAIEEWLRYATPESLSLYMHRSPRKAKRLYFDVIPRAVDDYLDQLRKFPDQTEKERYANPVWHVHDGVPPEEDVPVSFAMLLNLASACNAADKSVLWGFIRAYAGGASPETHPILDSLVGFALAYHEDVVKPTQRHRPPDERERAALEDLAASLTAFADGAEPEAIQHEVYEVGKRHGFENLRDWFRALYEILFGQSQGPRMGSFIALYGIDKTIALIRRALAGEGLPGSGDGAAAG